MQSRIGSDPGVGLVLLWAVRVGVMLVLATPLVVSPETFFPFVVGKAIYARSLIEATFAIWLILILYFPEHRPRRSWVVTAFAIWLLVSLVAGLIGVSPVRSLWSTYERMQGVFDLAHWFCFAVVAASAFRSLADWRLLFSANLGFGVLVSLLGFAQRYSWVDVYWLGDATRIQSTIGNATYVGAYAMVNALIGVGLLVHSFGRERATGVERPARRRTVRRRGQASARQRGEFDYVILLRAFWLISVFLSLWALWLTGTRGAVVGLGAGMLAFGITYAGLGRLKAARWIASGILVATIAVLVVFLVMRGTPALDPLIRSSEMLRRIAAISVDDQSIKGRIVSSGAGLRAFQDRPVLGWGPENYLIAWGRHFDSGSGIKEVFDQSHSKVIEELTTKGALGLLSYMAIWFAMAWAIVRTSARARDFDQLLITIVGATLLAYFAQNLFLFDTPTTVMMFSMLVGFVIAAEWATGRDEQPRDRWRLIPESWTKRLDLSRSFRTGWGVTAVATVVGVLLVASLVLLNFRAYYAAADVARSGAQNIRLDQRVSFLTGAIEDFPGLANYARMHLAAILGSSLLRLRDDGFDSAIELVSAEAEAGLEVEPENWRLLITMAQFFQVASERDPVYRQQAREYLDAGFELAPRTRETLGAIERQAKIEGR